MLWWFSYPYRCAILLADAVSDDFRDGVDTEEEIKVMIDNMKSDYELFVELSKSHWVHDASVANLLHRSAFSLPTVRLMVSVLEKHDWEPHTDVRNLAKRFFSGNGSSIVTEDVFCAERDGELASKSKRMSLSRAWAVPIQKGTLSRLHKFDEISHLDEEGREVKLGRADVSLIPNSVHLPVRREEHLDSGESGMFRGSKDIIGGRASDRWHAPTPHNLPAMASDVFLIRKIALAPEGILKSWRNELMHPGMVFQLYSDGESTGMKICIAVVGECVVSWPIKKLEAFRHAFGQGEATVHFRQCTESRRHCHRAVVGREGCGGDSYGVASTNGQLGSLGCVVAGSASFLGN
jgi:hypothetical protein